MNSFNKIKFRATVICTFIISNQSINSNKKKKLLSLTVKTNKNNYYIYLKKLN